MKVLVTGAAGFLGTTMVPMMLAKGWEVTAFDRFPQGMPFLAQCCSNPKFDVVQGDIREGRVIGEQIRKHDVIVNLAAIVGAPACDADQMAALNINHGAVAAMTGMLSKQQLMLQPTSDSGYGVGYEANICTEEHALNPTSLYGKSKVAAEAHVMFSGGISLRLASVFGASPRMRIDLIVNEFVWRAVHDRSVVLFEGHFRRNFVHVRDVARAFIHAVESGDGMRGNAYNCGASTQMMSKRELCDKIAAHVSGFEYHESPAKFDPDRRDYLIAYDKLEAAGWQPEHTVDQGIVELLKLYRTMSKGPWFNA